MAARDRADALLRRAATAARPRAAAAAAEGDFDAPVAPQACLQRLQPGGPRAGVGSRGRARQPRRSRSGSGPRRRGEPRRGGGRERRGPGPRRARAQPVRRAQPGRPAAQARATGRDRHAGSPAERRGRGPDRRLGGRREGARLLAGGSSCQRAPCALARRLSEHRTTAPERFAGPPAEDQAAGPAVPDRCRARTGLPLPAEAWRALRLHASADARALRRGAAVRRSRAGRGTGADARGRPDPGGLRSGSRPDRGLVRAAAGEPDHGPGGRAEA